MNLTHHFLIAMPEVTNTIFAGSVVYVCEHNQNGALGFIINKPADVFLQDLFDNMALPLERAELSSRMVFQGGPMATERGFVLHDAMRAIAGADDAHDHSAYVNTVPLTGGLDLTTSRDILEAVALGVGPQRLLVALGCSCWGEHQLEAELPATRGLPCRPTRPSSLNLQWKIATTTPWPCWVCKTLGCFRPPWDTHDGCNGPSILLAIFFGL